MNKSIHFWNRNEPENPYLISNFTKNIDFLTKWQKKITVLVKINLGQATNVNFKLKMLKFAENHIKTKFQEGLFLNFNFRPYFCKF